MEFHQEPSDGQAQARALLHSSGRDADLMELVEDRLLFPSGDPDARIHHRNCDELAVPRRLDRDGSALWSELDRIAQKVIEDLPESRAVSPDREFFGKMSRKLKLPDQISTGISESPRETS